MYFVSALSNLKYKDDVSAGRKHEATGESPHTLSASVLIKKTKHTGMTSAAENNMGRATSERIMLYRFARYLLDLTWKQDFILCHICFYFLAEKGSVALAVLACHLTAKGGHISEWCSWETTRSALHDWMARL